MVNVISPAKTIDPSPSQRVERMLRQIEVGHRSAQRLKEGQRRYLNRYGARRPTNPSCTKWAIMPGLTLRRQ